MRRYRVLQRNELTDRLVTRGSCDAESPEEAIRKVAYATNLSPTLFRAVDIGPARNL